MKKSIQMLGVASVAMLSAAAFAGNAPTTGGGGQGTGSTTSSANFGAAVSAVAAQGQGVRVTRGAGGTITISPRGGSAGGTTFAPVTISYKGGTYTVSANNGEITLTPVSE